MSRNFSMDDYVDVAERISLFAGKYPEGSLQSTVRPILKGEEIVGWLCEASAYRNPDDPRPGMGHAFEPVPGKTPFTKDSEAMNAETSAWGRAIIALGFQTKKIASANEVRARTAAGDGNSAQADTSKAEPAAVRKVSKAKLDRIEKMIPRLAELRDSDVHTVHDALIADLGKPFAELSPLEADELLEKMTRWESHLSVPFA